MNHKTSKEEGALIVIVELTNLACQLADLYIEKFSYNKQRNLLFSKESYN